MYIGQSRNITARKSQYKTLVKGGIGKKIYNSLKKYGWDKHTFEVIEECEAEQLNNREIYWIKYYNSVLEGLNIKEGGLGGYHSEETKRLIRLKAIGRKLSEEAKEKISKSKIGHTYNLGRKHSKETLQSPKYKNSRNFRNGHNPFTNESRKKRDEKIKKPIEQLDKQGKFIRLWDCQTTIAKVLDISQSAINNCLKGLAKSSAGYQWKYKTL